MASQRLSTHLAQVVVIAAIAIILSPLGPFTILSDICSNDPGRTGIALGPSACKLLTTTVAAWPYRSKARTAIKGKSFPSLLDADLEDLANGLESGLFTSVDLVNAYIARILEVNSTFRAVTQINPDALAIAADLDSARASGHVYGPLHGIPILIKDNIATADKMDNSAGSYALLGAKVPEDSTMAAKLREAGAIILGKTNLSQWANFRSLNTSNGWSAVGGQTEGPYVPQQDPSGSSSGSGVASALGLALASLGTETSGSILSPAGHNNLVGIKPTVGLTSRHLVIPISSRFDTVGPMARTVKDAAYLLAVIAGPDPKDNYTSAIPFQKVPDYVSACNYFALAGKRIGVPRNLIDFTDTTAGNVFEPAVLSAFNVALDVLRAAGAIIVDDLTLPGYTLYRDGDETLVIMQFDFVADLPGYLNQLATKPQDISSLDSLMAYTHRDPREAWPARDSLRWEQSLNLTRDSGGRDGRGAEAFWGNYTALRHFAGLMGITGALRNHSLDALVAPTRFAISMPAMLGAPVVTVPLGKLPAGTAVTRNDFGNLVTAAPGFPFGIGFMGPPFSEEMLVGLAYAFEQRTQVRSKVVPYLAPRTEVADVLRKREG